MTNNSQSGSKKVEAKIPKTAPTLKRPNSRCLSVFLSMLYMVKQGRRRNDDAWRRIDDHDDMPL